MDDYLSEKEQWEWVKAQVRENAPAVIVAVVVVVVGLFGWRWWQSRLDDARLAAGARYTQMVQALEAGDRTQALVSLGELERDYAGSPYTDQGNYSRRGYTSMRARSIRPRASSPASPRIRRTTSSRWSRGCGWHGCRSRRVKPTARSPRSARQTPAHSPRATTKCAATPITPRVTRRAALAEYRSAQAGAEGTDAALLGLKIADLSAQAPAATSAATAASRPAATPPAPPATPQAAK